MPEKTLTLNGSVVLAPGDTAAFVPPDPTVQYHFATGDPSVFVDIWKGSFAHGNGVARSKVGTGYCDHECGAGKFVITLDGARASETLTVTANSLWHRIFGWG